MKTYFSSTLFWGIINLIVISNVALPQDLPQILSSKTMPTESGIKLEFILSSYIKKDDVSSWIEQDNWFILNFYNVIRPESDFFKNQYVGKVKD